MPSFVCKDTGMDCTFTATAPTEAELMKKIAEHAKSAHKTGYDSSGCHGESKGCN